MPGMKTKLTPEQMKSLREKRGWTQQHLADLLGVHRATVGRWEKSEIPIPMPSQISARWILTSAKTAAA